MAEKVSTLGIERDEEFMYFVKSGAVYRLQRRFPGEEPSTEVEHVADVDVEIDPAFVYFLDGDGDVSRALRPAGDNKRPHKRSKSRFAGVANKTSRRPAKSSKRKAVEPIATSEVEPGTEQTTAEAEMTTVEGKAKSKAKKTSKPAADAKATKTKAKSAKKDRAATEKTSEAKRPKKAAKSKAAKNEATAVDADATAEKPKSKAKAGKSKKADKAARDKKADKAARDKKADKPTPAPTQRSADKSASKARTTAKSREASKDKAAKSRRK